MMLKYTLLTQVKIVTRSWKIAIFNESMSFENEDLCSS